MIEPHLARDGLLIGLQNGMSIDDVAAVVGAHRTVGAAIEVSSNMFEPRVVVWQSALARSWFAVGAIADSAHGRESEVVQVHEYSGAVEASADIRSSKWMKLAANTTGLAPSAILGLPLAAAVRVPGMQGFILKAGNEAVRSALAGGNRVMPIFGRREEDIPDAEQYQEHLLDAVLTEYTIADTKTTVLQGWLKGRRSEVDQISGLVVAEQLKVAGAGSAPANQLTLEHSHRIEAGRARDEHLKYGTHCWRGRLVRAADCEKRRHCGSRIWSWAPDLLDARSPG